MTECNKCGTQNRDKAKFCKQCGVALSWAAGKEAFFGKENIDGELLNFRKKMGLAAHIKKQNVGTKVGLDCLILGPQGSGKKFLAGHLIDSIIQEGIVQKEKFLEIDATDYYEWSNSLDLKLADLCDGVLLITNVHKILSGADSSQMTGLDSLFARMAKGSSLPVIMMTGLFNDMESYLASNQSIADLFEFHFKLSNMDEKALADLTAEILAKRFSTGISTDALEKLEKHYEWLVRMGEGTASNGRLAVRLAEELSSEMVSRGGNGTVLPEDIKGDIFIPRTEQEIWKDLDNIVGLTNVKEEIRNIIADIHNIKDHYVFIGNPGTGKTTIARKFAEILAAVGVLPKGQFIETDPSKIVGQYIGHSEKNMRDLVEQAMGGVLFIDEAYGLATSEFGRAAINTLVPLVENHKGEFVCILAGYKKEMHDFMQQNSGLASRFNKQIEFLDYNASELEQIFLLNARKAGYTLSDEAAEKLHIPMEQMYSRRSELFGNGREVRNFFDAAVQRMNKRIQGMGAEEREKEDRVLTYEDLVGEENTKGIDIEDVLARLDELVGLDSVKSNLRKMAAGVIRKKKLGKTADLVVEHYQFLGNPGTGKTTVARLMGEMLCALGLLPKSDVIEVGRQDLIGRYQGETAILTKDAVMRAMGGVLFIDEAYSLVNSGDDSYGHECINTLVDLLEKNRGKFVCICAGYTREMQNFINANSGLRSRLVNEIFFEDYDDKQLYEIFLVNCKKKGLILGEGSAEKAREIFTKMYLGRSSDFGNAREVRTFVGKVENHIAERTLLIEDATTDQLMTILPEDLIC